ncbi:uncharacterized protein EV420DRAFT_1564140 [Desarmillaria tabescens]|uniref:Uncharacterized protein n=1 Tax=Armillaria tabescens TaxID=1929756 RepID=A0AA39JVP7_ARMTA|nr:uncharacterized protein EV420DRAFT_1564140 [Desarmillaria tabescens]KAK0449797.1 hypothetical protein EV420DRAFT_1564140 [Desarmillaria tabescens]
MYPKILHRNMGSQKIQVMHDSRLVDDDGSLLEPIDLQLTVFETLLQDDTPVSGVSSLPMATPKAEKLEVDSVGIVEVGDPSNDDQHTPCPPGPLLQDYDSFSKGSVEGDFAFLPPYYEHDDSPVYSGPELEEDLGQTVPDFNSSLASLPLTEAGEWIPSWLQGVSQAQGADSPLITSRLVVEQDIAEETGKRYKRKHSVALSDDVSQRRVPLGPLSLPSISERKIPKHMPPD